MKTFSFGVGVVAILSTLAIAPVQRNNSEQPRPGSLKAKLSARVHDYKLDSPTFVAALARVATDFKLPMGIVSVDSARIRTNISLRLNDATVQQLLDRVAGSQPDYRIRIEQEMIHVSPAREIPGRENFLRIRIGTFEVHDEVIELAERKLHDLAKLKVSPPRPRPRQGVGGSLGTNTDDLPISVMLRGTTVEGVLDALALASDRKVWIVTFVGEPQLTPTGFRRTRTLWTERPIPPDEQPGWDMLRWGERIPNP